MNVSIVRKKSQLLVTWIDVSSSISLKISPALIVDDQWILWYFQEIHIGKDVYQSASVMRQRRVIISCVGQRFDNQIASVPDCFAEFQTLDRWMGFCSSRDEAGSTLELSPILKVLFTDCNSSPVKKDWWSLHFEGQGEELMELLTNASKLLPSSCAYLQGSFVSWLHLWYTESFCTLNQ